MDVVSATSFIYKDSAEISQGTAGSDVQSHTNCLA